MNTSIDSMDSNMDSSMDSNMDSSIDSSMDISIDDSTATVAFQLNSHKGSIAVKSPTQLKEFLLAPIVHSVETCVLAIAQAEVWDAFETAGFNAQYGFVNALQLQQWLFCAYKIPTNTTDIPLTRDNQKREYEHHFDKYY